MYTTVCAVVFLVEREIAVEAFPSVTASEVGSCLLESARKNDRKIIRGDAYVCMGPDDIFRFMKVDVQRSSSVFIVFHQAIENLVN